MIAPDDDVDDIKRVFAPKDVKRFHYHQQKTEHSVQASPGCPLSAFFWSSKQTGRQGHTKTALLLHIHTLLERFIRLFQQNKTPRQTDNKVNLEPAFTV